MQPRLQGHSNSLRDKAKRDSVMRLQSRDDSWYQMALILGSLKKVKKKEKRIESLPMLFDRRLILIEEGGCSVDKNQE